MQPKITMTDPASTPPPVRRRILITGGARGIGAGLAAAFAADGADIGLIGRDANRLDAISAHLNRPVVWRAADVGRREPLTRAIEEIAQALGGLDVLINN